MRESGFVSQNINKWNDFEDEINKSKRDPKKISRLFIQITDDLSYAQTFYKNRSVRVYLNSIAQLLFNDINRNSRIRLSAIYRFWKTELPIIMYNTRREFLISFIFFTICMGIGILSSVYEPDFARTIMGDKYVDMTIKNIENEDPMAVYKEMNELDMFLAITINNIWVAFRTFIFGLFLGFGTLLSLLNNGIMLGSFQYFFIERELFRESFLTIWQHGTLEISSIIIAGGAGLVLGKGLIFPGTYTRAQSLRLAARRGLKIMIGITPIFIIAGFIEGFFTRYTEAPDFLRLLTILFSLSFIIIYFVWYPRKIAKRYPERIDIADKLSSADNTSPDFTKIQSHEELFGNALKLFKDTILKIIPTLLFVIIGMATLVLYIFYSKSFDTDFIFLNRYSQLFNYRENYWLFFIHSIGLAFSLGVIAYSFNLKKSEERFSFKLLIKNSYQWIIDALVVSFSLNIVYMLSIGWGTLLLIALLPFVLLAFYISFNESIFILIAFDRMMRLLRNGFGKFLWLYLRFLFLSILIIFFLRPQVYWRSLTVVKWNLVFQEETINLILVYIVLVISFLGILICVALLLTSFANLYYTLKELNEANHLMEKVNLLGKRKTIKGYEVD